MSTGSGGPSVLIVDDEPEVARAVARVLRSRHRVFVETRPHEALARLERGERFDAIVCDLMMPEMAGWDLHAAVARLDAAQARRILFLTGGAINARATAFLTTTTNPHLLKPFDVEALAAALRRLTR